MGRRGRVGAAALEVVSISGVPESGPPDVLSEDQAEIWRSVVGAMPEGWFSAETHNMLVQYCRHVSRSHSIAKMIDELEKSKKPNPEIYVKLLEKEMKQSQTIAALATKMHINQRNTHGKKERRSAAVKKLWED